MKILFAGKSDFKYNRVQVLVSGLKKIANVEMDFFSIPKRKYFDKGDFKVKSDWADYIFIPPFRHRDVGFIKKHTSTPIIFDPLISKYLTKLDYGHFWKLPIKYFLDKTPFQQADILLTDTKTHRDYFIKKFNINPEQIFTLYIGADTQLFYSEEEAKPNEKFKVGFYGSFVPLQGTDKIIEAATLLKDHTDIEFDIIGDGYTYKKAKELAKQNHLDNIKFHGKVPYQDLNNIINSFDICLGIFGGSLKADSVIPNKIYHYASIGKAIITRNTKGIKELFTDGKDIALCDNSPEEIAKAILRLKENESLRKTLGENAALLIHNQFNETKIAESFLEIIMTYEANVGKRLK